MNGDKMETMAVVSQSSRENNVKEFVDLLSELRGIIEVRVVSGNRETWIGLRTGRVRPATVLLQQVNRAAVGFGLDEREVHFGILAD